MDRLECKIYHKSKKLIRRKHAMIRNFYNLLMDDEFSNTINTIDQYEEDIQDILIFNDTNDFKVNQLPMLLEIEEIKIQAINSYTKIILEYQELSNEEALLKLEGVIENSKNLLSKYYENFRSFVQYYSQKLTVIEHIHALQIQFKKINFTYAHVQRNIKNLSNLITASNARCILLKNIEELKTALEKKFQNFLKLLYKFKQSKMNPCLPSAFDSKCPSSSDDSNSSDDELYIEQEATEDEIKDSSDCFFIDQSLVDTRMGSIERLKTDAIQLDEQIKDIEEERNRIIQKITQKRNEILEILGKISESEENIQKIESIISDKLFTFQQRLIKLESKLTENFKTDKDEDIKNLLENELLELKENYHRQLIIDEKELYDLIQQSQNIAASIGDILPYIHKFYDNSNNDDQFASKIENLQKLIARPAQFCHDSLGRRFYFDNQKQKVFQDEHYLPHFILGEEGEPIVIKEGFGIESDESGEFYYDLKTRKIYISYYFENDLGRYYIDIHGDRHYKVDSEASEYMLVNGVWIKTKEGIYEKDEKGLRIMPEKQEINVADQKESKEFDQKDVEGLSNSKFKITSEDMRYIKENVGMAIIKACASTYAHKPSDPLNYFANYLLHYRYTEKMLLARDRELNYFVELKKHKKEAEK